MKSATPSAFMVSMKRLAWLLWSACIVALSLFYLCLGEWRLPGLHWDASFYATPVINVAQGHGWLFDSFEYYLLRWPSRMYDFHGVVHVFLYGAILKASSYASLFRWLSVINAANFIAYTLLFKRALEFARGWSLPLSLLAGSMAGMISLALQGRPEQLIPLILMLPWISFYLGLGSRRCVQAAGIAVGVTFVTSPLPGILLGVVSLSFLALTRKKNATELRGDILALVTFASITSAAVVQFITPFGFVHWFQMLLQVLKIGTVNFTHWFFKPFEKGDLLYGFTAYAPLWNWLVIAGFLVILAALLKQKRWTFSAILVASLFFFVPRGADYTYIGLFPAMILAFVEFVSKGRLSLFPASLSTLRSRQFLSIAVLIATSGLYAPGFARIAYNALHVYRDQPDYVREGICSEVLKDVQPGHLAQKKLSIGFPSLFTPSPIALADNSCLFITKKALMTPPGLERGNHPETNQAGLSVDYYILPKSVFIYQEYPPSKIYVDGIQFDLTKNFWQKENRKIFGFTAFPDQLAQGYEVAIYRRSDASFQRGKEP